MIALYERVREATFGGDLVAVLGVSIEPVSREVFILIGDWAGALSTVSNIRLVNAAYIEAMETDPGADEDS